MLVRLVLILAVAATVLGGCRSLRARTTTQGTMRCSCSGAGCSCTHCTGEDTSCRCRATDAYGGHGNVGGPGD